MDVILAVSVFIHVSYFMLADWCTDFVQSVGMAIGLLRATATHAPLALPGMKAPSVAT